MIGDWERLKFDIDYNKFLEDEKNISHWYRPFQPKKGILNDRESILLYGLEGINLQNQLVYLKFMLS